jgi:hypothetical protein
MLGIRVHDGEVLLSVGEVLCDAFREGVERMAEENTVRGVRHDLHLGVDVDVVKGELDVAEAAACFGDG